MISLCECDMNELVDMCYGVFTNMIRNQKIDINKLIELGFSKEFLTGKYSESLKSDLQEGFEKDYINFPPNTKYVDKKEIITPLPKFLYHGTSKENWEKIKKEGNLTVGNKKNWSGSNSNSIYLTQEKDDAIIYCSNAGIEDIVIIRIPTKDLDLNKLYIDSNEEYYNINVNDEYKNLPNPCWDVFNYEYRDSIPVKKSYKVEV